MVCPDCPYVVCQGASCLEVDVAVAEAQTKIDGALHELKITKGEGGK